jgi:nucleotide-binding universal stress UspA family protein
MRELKERLEGVKESAKAEWTEKLAELDTKRKAAGVRLEEVQRSAGDAWEHLREGATRAWEELEDAVQKARKEF